MSVWDLNRRMAARDVAADFAGTPHRDRMALPREGVDCVNFVLAVLIRTGVVPPAQLPFYHEALGSLRRRNVIEDILAAHLHCDVLQPGSPAEFGDIVVCQCGRQSNHVGIIIDGSFWHCPARGHCGPEAWHQWAARAQCLVRVTAPGYKAAPASLTWDAILAAAEGRGAPCQTTPG